MSRDISGMLWCFVLCCTSMNMSEESNKSVTLSDNNSNTRSCACKEILVSPPRAALRAAEGTGEGWSDKKKILMSKE